MSGAFLSSMFLDRRRFYNEDRMKTAEPGTGLSMFMAQSKNQGTRSIGIASNAN